MNAPDAIQANQFRKGLLEFCVLSVIARGEVYVSDLIDALTQARMAVVEGTLYPMLTRLKNAGLLAYVWRESASGPPRKYYALTDSGREQLAGQAAIWRETVAAVEGLLAKALPSQTTSADDMLPATLPVQPETTSDTETQTPTTY